MPFNGRSEQKYAPASLITVSAVAVLIPAACVVWFMNAAMRNEGLAAQERLAEVYRKHLASLDLEIGRFWQARVEALRMQPSRPAAEAFSTKVGEGVADSIVFYGDGGRAVYPTLTAVPEERDGLARRFHTHPCDIFALSGRLRRG